MTAPVAFWVRRAHGGELRPVYERNGVRWTEGGQKSLTLPVALSASIYVKEIDTYDSSDSKGSARTRPALASTLPTRKISLVVGGDQRNRTGRRLIVLGPWWIGS